MLPHPDLPHAEERTQACEPAVDLGGADDVPEGVLRSLATFLRDLPQLLANRKYARQWVVYHGEKRVAVGPSKRDLYQECLRRGLSEREFIVRRIVPQAPREVDFL